MALEPVPESTALDYTMAVAKVASLAFPFLGSGVTLFELVTAPIRGKRFNGWCEALRLELNKLCATVEGLTPEKLAVSEPFISAFAHATQVALRTQQQEKLEALRNAVLNVATRATEIDEDRQTAFLSLIDRFTPAHIRILEKFRNFPTEGRHDQWSVNKQNPGTPTHWLKEFVPGLREESTNFIRMLIADLYQAGLSSIEPNAQAMPLQAITDVGLGFLNFISAHK